MKLLFPTILNLFILSSGLVSAQSYKYVPFPDSARWTYYYYPDRPWPYLGMFTYTAAGDTNIDSMVYTKLYLEDDWRGHWHTYVGALREENRKVYFRSAFGEDSPVFFAEIPDTSRDKDELLYDFSVNNFSLWMPFFSDLYQADSVGYEIINGSYRKLYEVFNPIYGYTSYEGLNIYEGIGDEACLFSKFTAFPILSSGEFTILVCFEDFKRGFTYQPRDSFRTVDQNGNHQWNMVRNCGVIADIQSTTFKRTFIYPTPSEGFGYLSIRSSLVVEELYVYDTWGREVLAFKNPSYRISTDDLVCGVYFVELVYENGNHEVLKYIK